MTVIATIALGGNLGDVPLTFRAALNKLVSRKSLTNQELPPPVKDGMLLDLMFDCEVLKVSSNWQTKAIGTHAGFDYINAAALIKTDATPIQLLQRLQQIEHDLGRIRTLHWGPRTLDLDLISYGDQIIHLPADVIADSGEDSPPTQWLAVPHPACWYRQFVLAPWLEIAPDWEHPILKQTVRQLREQLLRRPLVVSWYEPELPEQLTGSFAREDINFITTSSLKHLNVEIAPDLKFQLSTTTDHTRCNSADRTIVLPVDDPVIRAIQIINAALDVPVKCA